MKTDSSLRRKICVGTAVLVSQKAVTIHKVILYAGISILFSTELYIHGVC